MEKMDNEIKTGLEFSVLIPVYNSQNTLERCLLSVLEQTFEDFEVIAVDDCSEDSSAEILRDFTGKDSRLRTVSKEVNSSLLSARLTGMREAKGDHILFVDSDDYIEKDTLKGLSQQLSAHPADITEFNYIKEPEGERCDNTRNYPDDKTFSTDHLLEYMLLGKCEHMVWNKCYSRGLIRRVLDRAEDFYCNMSEDMYFSGLFFTLAESYEKTDSVYYHYVTEGGMSADARQGDLDIDKTVFSLRNKNDHLRSFLESDNPKLLNLFEKSLMSEADQFADIIRFGSRDIQYKLDAFKTIDEAFGTKYGDDYLEKHRWFDVFLNASPYVRFKMTVSRVLKKIGIKR